MRIRAAPFVHSPRAHPGTARHDGGWAFHGQELLDSDRFPSVTKLLEALGLDRSFVSRFLRPGIIEVIARGEEPRGLSQEWADACAPCPTEARP